LVFGKEEYSNLCVPEGGLLQRTQNLTTSSLSVYILLNLWEKEIIVTIVI
jgi:hypothetical protein